MINQDLYYQKEILNIKKDHRLNSFVQSKIESLGFELYDFSVLPGENSINVLLTSLPEEMMKIYKEENFEIWDMFIDHIFCTEKPILLSKHVEYLNKCEYTSQYYKKNKLIVELVQDYDIAESYTIPVFFNGRKKCIFTVASTKTEGSEFKKLILENRKELNLLGNSISLAFHKNFKRYPGFNDNVLTPREMDVIYSLAREAKTTQQVADYLNMSVSSVNKHIEKIKNSLGAISTSNAIYLAMRKKLIE